MDSLKWNAIKFVWICFGLVPFSRFIMIIERFSWHFISYLFVRLPFSHQIHTAWICTGLRTFTYLTVVFVHLIILFFIFNQLNFPNAKVKCNAKSHLKLVSDWYLIKITANKWISISLFAFGRRHCLFLSHLRWRFFICIEGKWSICCHLKIHENFSHRIPLSPLTPVIFHRRCRLLMPLPLLSKSIAIGQNIPIIFIKHFHNLQLTRWDRFISVFVTRIGVIIWNSNERHNNAHTRPAHAHFGKL